MNIGIDGYEANQHKLVGVGKFAYELIQNIYKSDRKNSYSIFLPSRPLEFLPPQRDNWLYHVLPSKGLWTFISLPFGIWTKKPKLDIFFSPTHYIPRFISIPRVVSIMDLSYLHFPNMFRKKDLHQLKNWTAYSIKNSRRIITISEFTKSEIMKYYDVTEDKIIVAYPGYDKEKFKVQSASWRTKFKVNEIKKRYGIQGEYILFVGTLQPRKNLIRLIEAFKLAMKQLNNLTMNLIIVGKRGWFYKDIFQKAKDEGLKDRVKFLEFIPTEDMPYIYSQAKCFVLPSLYEGFGIPVIEALACGIPVVISNTSSLPEVGGDAGIYINPENVGSIKDGILKVLNFTDKERKYIVEKGFKQIERFSWDKSAKIVLNTLKDIK